MVGSKRLLFITADFKLSGTIAAGVPPKNGSHFLQNSQNLPSADSSRLLHRYIDWLFHYGYKKHHVTDANGLVLVILTTPANVNEISNLEEVLETVEIPKGSVLYGDKGYQSAKNTLLLQDKSIKNRILKKAKKNQPLTETEKKFNKLCGKVRYKIERTFGSIKC